MGEISLMKTCNWNPLLFFNLMGIHVYSRNLMMIKFLLLCLTILFSPTESFAAFNENPFVDPKGIGLANNCTAVPPVHMAAHYNPAGLSKVAEGSMFSNGFALPIITRTGKFNSDPDFKGFLNGSWGADSEFNPNDPEAAHGGRDPLDGKKGTNESGRMYLPFIGPIDFLAGPTLGLSKREPGSKWTFAYTNYAPYGGGLNHDDKNDPMRFGCKTLYLQHLVYAAPVVSYKISDELAIGFTAAMAQTAMGVTMDQRTPNEMVALTRMIGDATRDLEIPVVSEQTLPPPFLGGGLGPYEHNTSLEMNLRDDFSPSFNFGILWEPSNFIGFGFCYQSQATSDLSGEYKFDYSEQWQRHVDWNGSTSYTLQTAGMLDIPYVSVPYQSGTVTAKQKFPQRMDFGVKISPFRKLRLLTDLHWSNWSIDKTNKFVFDQRIQLMRVAKLLGYTGGDYSMVVTRNMKDTWHWGVGLEFDVSERLTLRCGYEKRPTSTNPDTMDALYLLPGDMEYYGAGLTIKAKKGITLDFAVGYLTDGGFKADNNTSTNYNSTDFTKIVYNPYAGLDYEQDTSLFAVAGGITMPLAVNMELIHNDIQKVKKLLYILNPFK